jgi:hypothetical protein
MSRTDPNDPRRCEATTQSGQCAHQAVDGQNLCAYHMKDRDVEDKMSLRSYILTDTVLAESAGRHSQVEELKSLREEIAICRSLVERRLNMIESNADLLAAVGQVNSLFLTLEKLISSCHRLETSLGTLLSRSSLLELAKGIVGTIMDELEGIDNYEEIVDTISEKILRQIASYDPDEK